MRIKAFSLTTIQIYHLISILSRDSRSFSCVMLFFLYIHFFCQAALLAPLLAIQRFCTFKLNRAGILNCNHNCNPHCCTSSNRFASSSTATDSFVSLVKMLFCKALHQMSVLRAFFSLSVLVPSLSLNLCIFQNTEN